MKKLIARVFDGVITEIREVDVGINLGPECVDAVIDPAPNINAETEKAFHGTPVVDGPIVRIPWVVVPLSQDELGAIAAKKAEDSERAIATLALAALDARTATSVQVQRILAFVLRRILKT